MEKNVNDGVNSINFHKNESNANDMTGSYVVINSDENTFKSDFLSQPWVKSSKYLNVTSLSSHIPSYNYITNITYIICIKY